MEWEMSKMTPPRGRMAPTGIVITNTDTGMLGEPFD
jgi:hypothetical protein